MQESRHSWKMIHTVVLWLMAVSLEMLQISRGQQSLPYVRQLLYSQFSVSWSCCCLAGVNSQASTGYSPVNLVKCGALFIYFRGLVFFFVNPVFPSTVHRCPTWVWNVLFQIVFWLAPLPDCQWVILLFLPVWHWNITSIGKQDLKQFRSCPVNVI